MKEAPFILCRCISIDQFGGPDPLLRKACLEVGLTSDVMSYLPKYIEMVQMWIDPGEVTVKVVWSYCRTSPEQRIFKGNFDDTQAFCLLDIPVEQDHGFRETQDPKWNLTSYESSITVSA
eukprot:TRINITY_DN1106_c0_g1_i3.p1 TRINITY_DN1106_c0_g1~~TRINITY_DN1106_c0_g1_i3.p1  ORF type:complete len:120 (+),score=12.18 TRINITY_DN1106_c0_g1_i3:305-664(+)